MFFYLFVLKAFHKLTHKPCLPSSETCPRGTFTDGEHCTRCPPGHYSYSEDATSCTECAIATYQELSGQTSCSECGVDEITAFTGSTSPDDCFVDEGLFTTFVFMPTRGKMFDTTKHLLRVMVMNKFLLAP